MPGETKPLVPDAQAEEDHAKNRRVQFVILEAGAGSPTVKQVRESGPTESEPESQPE